MQSGGETGGVMSGETNLDTLLRTLNPTLHADTYVFCTIPEGQYGDMANANPIASVMEEEGLTLVLSQMSAEKVGLPYTGTFRCIRLEVHSSLEAVGLTAAVSQRLAEQGISANMVAGFYHDHIFVPACSADQALQTLLSFGA